MIRETVMLGDVLLYEEEAILLISRHQFRQGYPLNLSI